MSIAIVNFVGSSVCDVMSPKTVLGWHPYKRRVRERVVLYPIHFFRRATR